MLIYADTASLKEITEWNEHPWISGFTTNPTLVKGTGVTHQDLIAATQKDISIDGLQTSVFSYPPHVWAKVKVPVVGYVWERMGQTNWTAICSIAQVRKLNAQEDDIVSVFAGRIMDTGRDPQPVIDAAKRTGARVLWASVREPYNFVQAERAGCDIITSPPAILRKWLAWQGKPLEVVAAETIRQFEQDSQWT